MSVFLECRWFCCAAGAESSCSKDQPRTLNTLGLSGWSGCGGVSYCGGPGIWARRGQPASSPGLGRSPSTLALPMAGGVPWLILHGAGVGKACKARNGVKVCPACALGALVCTLQGSAQDPQLLWGVYRLSGTLWEAVAVGGEGKRPGLHTVICKRPMNTAQLLCTAKGSRTKRKSELTCPRSHQLAGPRFSHLHKGHTALKDLIDSPASKPLLGLSKQIPAKPQEVRGQQTRRKTVERSVLVPPG